MYQAQTGVKSVQHEISTSSSSADNSAAAVSAAMLVPSSIAKSLQVDHHFVSAAR